MARPRPLLAPVRIMDFEADMLTRNLQTCIEVTSNPSSMIVGFMTTGTDFTVVT